MNRSKRTRILVVEDEGLVAADLQEHLTELDYEVVAVVDTAEAALREAARLRPDLVLMDIMLAGQMDGVEAADRITREQDVPVVFLTAHADQATLARGKATGPYGYIVKPFGERELHVTIEIALYRHQAEARIRQLEHRHKALIGSIHEAVIATDRWGLVTSLNPAASALTGWALPEALNKSLDQVAPLLRGPGGERLVSPISRVLQDRVTFADDQPAWLLPRQGSERPVLFTLAPILDDAGTLLGVVAVFRETAAPPAESQAPGELRPAPDA
jgi:PAS domain S-box-containing protein